MTKKGSIVLFSILIAAIFLSACAKQTPKAVPTPTSPVDTIVGDWTGTMYLPDGGDTLGQLDISIQAGCAVDKICGSYSIPQIPCGGTFVYKGINGEAFRFEQQLTKGDVTICGTGSFNEITLLKDGTLSQTWTDGVNKTKANLTRK
jgi:hypothetical protein